MGYLSKAVSTTASYLPAQVTDTLNQTRAVATVTVPNSPVIAPNTVAIANISRQTRLLLASSDGYLYIYNLPGEQRVISYSIITGFLCGEKFRLHELAPLQAEAGSHNPILAFWTCL